MVRHAKNSHAGSGPIAIIDIGSNSIRLVIYESAVRSPTPFFNEKLLCGLGRKLLSSGRLNPKAVNRALAALRRFRMLADNIGVSQCFVVATEAVRRASDGEDFIRQAEECCRCKIRVLEGWEEAELGAAGVVAAFVDPDGLAGDLGGGSLELIDLQGEKMLHETSLPLGSLNLMDLAGKDYAKASAEIDRQLDGIDWLKRGQGRPFYAIGGTWRSVARLHMMETRYPLSILHHYVMTPKEVSALCDAVIKGGPGVKTLPRISSDRREMLPYGLLLMQRLVNKVKPSAVVYSIFGVREGLLYQLLSQVERARDPLLAASEEMAVRRARSLDYGRELFQWMNGIFEGAGQVEKPEERRLREAACLLFDVGWRGHPDYRGEKALGLIAQSSFVGVDHPGRAFLALAVYYNYEKLSLSGGFSPALRKLIGSKWNLKAQIMGLASRAASKLSGCMPGILKETSISYDGKCLVLQLPSKYEALDGEAVRRRFKLLAQQLQCEFELQIAADKGPAPSFLRSFASRQ